MPIIISNQNTKARDFLNKNYHDKVGLVTRTGEPGKCKYQFKGISDTGMFIIGLKDGSEMYSNKIVVRI